MEIIIHRVNTRKQLEAVPETCGAEIDLRADKGEIILHHDVHQKGESFGEWLNDYGSRGTLVLNVKETGVEDEALQMVREAGVQSYFLLDVEFPYLYQAANRGVRDIALRFSEAEPAEAVSVFDGRVDWVWIDTNTRLPIDDASWPVLSRFKSCLVCPERWGRPQDIQEYRKTLEEGGWELDAVMTSLECAKYWQ